MSLQRFENRQSPRKGAYLIRRWLQMKCGRQSGSSNSAFRPLWVIEFDTELWPIDAVTGSWRRPVARIVAMSRLWLAGGNAGGRGAAFRPLPAAPHLGDQRS